MILKELQGHDNSMATKQINFPKRPFETSLNNLLNTCVSFWVEEPGSSKKSEKTLLHISTSPTKQLLKITLASGHLKVILRFANKIERKQLYCARCKFKSIQKRKSVHRPYLFS